MTALAKSVLFGGTDRNYHSFINIIIIIGIMISIIIILIIIVTLIIMVRIPMALCVLSQLSQSRRAFLTRASAARRRGASRFGRMRSNLLYNLRAMNSPGDPLCAQIPSTLHFLHTAT